MPDARWTVTDALPGRERPDAAEAPSGRLDAGTEVTELERLGLWVRVETADEARYWVDGRRLTERAEVPTEAPSIQEAARPEPTPQPAPPPVQPAAPVWTATHTVPPEGLQAWARPDPAGAVVANLAGGVELRIEERMADWAHVSAENGWKGWVDGRRLVAAAPAATPPPPVSPASPPAQHPAFATATTDDKPAAKSVSFSWRSIAAFAVLVTVFLPWLRLSYGFGSVDATDVPAAFLFSLDPDSSFPNMGTVMMALAAAVLATEFWDKAKEYRRFAAWATLGVAALYLVQTYRFFQDVDENYLTAFSTMFSQGFAIGPWVALAAGVVLVLKQPEDAAA